MSRNETGLSPAAPAGERLRRLEQRRRLLREELLAIAALVVALAITLAVLATQWLTSGPSAPGALPGVVPGAVRRAAPAVAQGVPGTTRGRLSSEAGLASPGVVVMTNSGGYK